jgi:mannose-6-phosphate isomerase
VSALLPIRQVAKPWGRDLLPAPFSAPSGERIGEIWFEPPPAVPQLLVKYIFTSEALSVQVHPSDAQAPGHGKEECWLVIDAEPGARLGIGFDRAIGAEAMRAAATDGSIEQMLTWHPVSAGDFFYIPANTVHAIGAGVSLIEVQQNSDVTYRLYDYGRPRELHLDQGIAVARGETYDRSRWHCSVGEREVITLVNGPLFRLDQVVGQPDEVCMARFGDAPLLAIPRAGMIKVSGEPVVPGSCALLEHVSALSVPHGAVVLLAQPCAP